jgi:hypothetical protein
MNYRENGHALGWVTGCNDVTQSREDINAGWRKACFPFGKKC